MASDDEADRQIRATFNFMDSKMKGIIDVRELNTALLAIGFEVHKVDIRRLYHYINKDLHDDNITLDEYRKMVYKLWEEVSMSGPKKFWSKEKHDESSRLMREVLNFEDWREEHKNEKKEYDDDLSYDEDDREVRNRLKNSKTKSKDIKHTSASPKLETDVEDKKWISMQQPPQIDNIVANKAQGVQESQVESPQQQFSINNNLQIYTQQNYLIDSATQRFSGCLPQIEGLTEIEEPKRYEWVERQIKFINSIATNFKFNALYVEKLRNSLPIINRINDNLQNQDFITRLLAQRYLPGSYQPDPKTWIETNLLSEYRHNGPPPNPYVKYTRFFTNLLNIGCYTGESRGRYELTPEEKAIFTPLHDAFIVNLFEKMIHTYVLWKTESIILNGVKIYETVPTGGPIKILPHLGNRIEIGFFQQYFQCFFDFLTALLEVNYNEQIEKNRVAEEARKESYKKMMEMKSISDKHQLDYKKLPKVKDRHTHPEYMEYYKKEDEIAKKYKEAKDNYKNTKSTNLGGTKRRNRRTKRGTKKGYKLYSKKQLKHF